MKYVCDTEKLLKFCYNNNQSETQATGKHLNFQVYSLALQCYRKWMPEQVVGDGRLH